MNDLIINWYNDNADWIDSVWHERCFERGSPEKAWYDRCQWEFIEDLYFKEKGE